MKKTLIFGATFVCAAFTANAQLVTNWSGDVWSYTAQPDYAADLTIHAADGSSATLVSNVAPGSHPAQHLMDGIFYSHNTNPTLTGNISTVLPGLEQIIVEITYAGAFQGTGYGLSFNGDATVYNPTEDRVTVPLTEPVVTPIGPFDGIKQTAIWNIADLGLVGQITSIQFVLPMGSFAGLVDVTVTQVVPEPSTYALLAGAFGLAAVVVARRRRRV